jgi:hypothetical protein
VSLIVRSGNDIINLIRLGLPTGETGRARDKFTGGWQTTKEMEGEWVELAGWLVCWIAGGGGGV